MSRQTDILINLNQYCRMKLLPYSCNSIAISLMIYCNVLLLFLYFRSMLNKRLQNNLRDKRLPKKFIHCKIWTRTTCIHTVSDRLYPVSSPHPTPAITNNTIHIDGSGWDGGRYEYQPKPWNNLSKRTSPLSLTTSKP